MNKRVIKYCLAALAFTLVILPLAAAGLEYWIRYGTTAFQLFRNQFALLACLPLLLGTPLFSAWADRRLPLRPWRALLLVVLQAEVAGLAAFFAYQTLKLADFKKLDFLEYLRYFPWPVLPWQASGSLLYALMLCKRGVLGRLLSLGAGIAAFAGYWFYLQGPTVGAETHEQLMWAYRVTRHAWCGTLFLAIGAVLYGAIRRIRLQTATLAVWPGWLMMAGAFLFFLHKPTYPAHISLHDLEEKPFLGIQWAGLDDSGRLIVLGSAYGQNEGFENSAILLLRFEAKRKRMALIRRTLVYPASPMDRPGEFMGDGKRVVWMAAAPLLRQLNLDHSRCEIVMLKSGRTKSFRWLKFSEQRHSFAPKCRPMAFGPKAAWASWDAEEHALRGVTTEGKSFSRSLPVSTPPRLLSTAQYLIVLAATAGDDVPSRSIHPATTVIRIAWNNGEMRSSELPGQPARQKEADNSGGAAFALRDPQNKRETWYRAEDPDLAPLNSGAAPEEKMLPAWNGSNKPDWISLERLSFLLRGSGYDYDPRSDTVNIRVIAGHWLVEQDRSGLPIALIEFGAEQRSGQIVAALVGAVDWQKDSVVFLTRHENRQEVIQYFPASGQREILLELQAPSGQSPTASQAPALFKFAIIAASPPQSAPVIEAELPGKPMTDDRQGCNAISRIDRDHLSYILPELHPAGGGRCGMGMGPMRWKSPTATEACVWHLLNGCRPGDDAALCAQARLPGASATLLRDLQFNRLPCDISKRGASVIGRIRDPESRVNFCMSIALMGGPADCLTKLRPEIVKLIRPSNFPSPSGYRILNLSNFVTRFASPKYRHLDPWLRSLPPSKSPQFNSTAAAVLAFHSGNQDKLLEILAKDQEPLIYNTVSWLTRLAPAVDIAKQSERRGASSERVEEIRKAVESIKKFPDQLERSVAPDNYYCESGEDPCHDEASCVELLYADGGPAPGCSGRAIFAANHCEHDVACTACVKDKSGALDCTDIYARKKGGGQQSLGRFNQCGGKETPAVKCTAVSDPPACRAP